MCFSSFACARTIYRSYFVEFFLGWLTTTTNTFQTVHIQNNNNRYSCNQVVINHPKKYAVRPFLTFDFNIWLQKCTNTHLHHHRQDLLIFNFAFDSTRNKWRMGKKIIEVNINWNGNGNVRFFFFFFFVFHLFWLWLWRCSRLYMCIAWLKCEISEQSVVFIYILYDVRA